MPTKIASEVIFFVNLKLCRWAAIMDRFFGKFEWQKVTRATT
jgi:hypothetical protein